MLRCALRRSNTSPEGVHVHSYGIRFGYWPCLNAPFINVAFAIWQFDLWYGLPSYKPKD